MASFFLTLTINGVQQKATRLETELWLYITKLHERALKTGHAYIQPSAARLAKRLGAHKRSILRSLRRLALAGRIYLKPSHRISERTGKPYRRPNEIRPAKRRFSGWFANQIRKALSSVAEIVTHTNSHGGGNISVSVSSPKKVDAPFPARSTTTAKPSDPAERLRILEKYGLAPPEPHRSTHDPT